MIMNGKNYYDQPVDSDIKRFEYIRKLTTGKLKITLPDVYYIMNTPEIIID